jgi:hypothetical protein
MSLIGHVYLLPQDRVQALLASPSTVFETIDRAYNEPSAGFVDLDKAWHCLHYLLTGSAQGGDPPLNFIINGGTPVGDEDVGHGPARVLQPLETAAVADALARIDEAALLARLDPKKLEKLGVYPGGWDQLNLRSDYELGYYLGPFRELKRVTQRAKEERLGMIVWIG